MVGCVEFRVEFGRRLAQRYNTESITNEPIDVTMDSVDPRMASFHIDFLQKRTGSIRR